MHHTREMVKEIKEMYPSGTEVRLVEMRDQYTKMEPGLKGIVDTVDDIGTIHVTWENGRKLGVVFGVDTIRKIIRTN